MKFKRKTNWGEDVPLTMNKIRDVYELLYGTTSPEYLIACQLIGAVKKPTAIEEIEQMDDLVDFELFAFQKGQVALRIRKQMPHLPSDAVYSIEYNLAGKNGNMDNYLQSMGLDGCSFNERCKSLGDVITERLGL